MAIYSATVVSPMKGAERISRSLGVFAGKCAVGNYNQTLARITGITKFFKPTGNATTGGFTHGIVSVDIVNPSELGYLANWDYTTGCFKCWYADASRTPALTLATSAAMSAGGVALLANASTAAVAVAIGITGTTVNTINCNAIAAAAASQLASDINAGTFGFVAVGFI